GPERHLDPELLAQLTAQRLGRLLALLDLPARELPASRERDRLGPARGEQTRRVLDMVHDRPGDHERACPGAQHGRSVSGGRGATSTGRVRPLGGPQASTPGRDPARGALTRPAAAGQRRPAALAQATASARVETPILLYTDRTWDFTVLRETNSSAASSSSVRCSESRDSTTFSRRVSGST